jgi:hypothetical protein
MSPAYVWCVIAGIVLGIMAAHLRNSANSNRSEEAYYCERDGSNCELFRH